jgi:hypothetical protein
MVTILRDFAVCLLIVGAPVWIYYGATLFH